MNQTIQAILNRRSTRIFKDEMVNKDALDAIIQSALYAPSAHNQQPWHFTVVQNKDFINHMNDISKETARQSESEFLQKVGHNDQFHVFYNAPVVIIVSGDESAMSPKLDTAAAAENMLIAAESLGLGSCWVGMLRLCVNGEVGKPIVEKFELPEGYLPYFAVVIGHKANEGAKAPKRKEGKVTYID